MSLQLMFRVISPPPLTGGIQLEGLLLDARWRRALRLRLIHAVGYELAKCAIVAGAHRLNLDAKSRQIPLANRRLPEPTHPRLPAPAQGRKRNELARVGLQREAGHLHPRKKTSVADHYCACFL
jgi:hypothetical protein